MPPISGVNSPATPTITAHTANTNATTPIGKPISAGVSFNEGPNTHKTRVMYAPFASPDMVKMAIGQNLVRTQQGKPISPLICRTEQDKSELEKTRKISIREQEQEIEKLQSKISDHKEVVDLVKEGGFTHEEACDVGLLTPSELQKTEERLNVLLHTSDALKNLTITNSDALKSLSPDQHKLYVLGHGGPGLDLLAADPDCKQGKVTAYTLALQLAKAGLDPLFSDIRVTSCYSADTRVPVSLKDPDALKDASKPRILRNGNRREPFAQTLSTKMRNVGFTQVSVSGYHGQGLTFSSFMGDGKHHLHKLPDQESGTISSTVRQIFTP